MNVLWFKNWLRPARRWFCAPRLWSVLGVLSASVIMVNVNVLSARFYERWDWTETQAFTLSTSTIEIVEALGEPLDVVVFLSQGDRLLVDVRHMLKEYQAHSRMLQVSYVDPERDPAEFLALQQKFGIVAGKTQDGKLLTDASIVIARGDKRWFITADDLLSVDPEGNVEPRLELALTEGIAQVIQGQTLRICFTTGHQEVSIDEAGPHGLSELRLRLTKSNLAVETLDLGKANLSRDLLKPCHVIAIAGPKVPFAASVAQKLRDYFMEGGSLLLLLEPFVDENGKLGKSGLQPVVNAGGITLGNDFVIERDSELRLPSGFGEAFLATPKQHTVTEGFVRRGGRVDFRVLLVGSQSLGTTADSPAKPLLTSSAQSFALDDLSHVQKGENLLVPLADDESGPYYLALAAELPETTPATRSNAPAASAKRRMLVTGAANPAWSRNWRDPSLAGNRLFMESAIAWLAARPALVSVPKRRSFPAGLSLTEESLTDVLLYVMLYMPLTGALMGGFVLFRRRRQEAHGRQKPASRSGSS